MSAGPSSSGTGPNLPPVNLDVGFAGLDPNSPLQDWFNDKMKDKTELEQLAYARAISNSAVNAGKRINEISNVCYNWISARDVSNPIWTNTKISRDEFLLTISYQDLEAQSRLFTLDEERKNRALLKISPSLGNVSLEQLEGGFGELWPKRPSQEFLRVLAKVSNLLKSIPRIVERITPIIEKRLGERQRPKEKHMLQGDLAEIQEYKDWQVAMKVRREAYKREKEILGAGASYEPEASSTAGPSSAPGTPAASNSQAKRKRGENRKSGVMMVEGKLTKHDGMTIKIKEGENRNRIITGDRVIQELKAILLRKGQKIPPNDTLNKAGDITRTLVNSDERRLADRLELIIDWVDKKKDVEWRKSGDNRTWEESFESVVEEQGKEYMEEMTEFTLEDKEILDYIALNLLPIGPDSRKDIDKVVELILEW